MSLWKDAPGVPATLEALSALTHRLSTIATTGPSLPALLSTVSDDLTAHWPNIAHSTITLGASGDSGTLPASLEAQVLANGQRAAHEDASGQVSWALPLHGPDTTLGVLSLRFSPGYHPDESTAAALDTLTATLSLVMQYALHQAEQATAHHRREQHDDQLAAFGKIITLTQDPLAIMQRTADFLPTVLPADSISIGLPQPNRPQWQFMNFGAHIANTITHELLADTSLEAVVQTQHSVLQTISVSSPHADHRQQTRWGISQTASVPIIAGGDVIGVLTIGHSAAQPAYTDSDLRLLQHIANLLALALQNAGYSQSVQQNRQYEATLDQITEHLQQQNDLQTMLSQALRDLGQALGAKRARIRLSTDQAPPETPSGS